MIFSCKERTFMSAWVYPVGAVVLGYLLGSIPFGLILSRVFGAGDIRQIGSGNIGATNVLRTGRKGLAAATLALDMLKGFAAVILGGMIAPDAALLGGVGAFLGHVFPVWLGFKGGKGVATMLGIALGIAWPVGFAFALIWIGALGLTRISSVSGMAAAVAAPIAAFLVTDQSAAIMLTGLALIVILKHRDNITRLIAGTEPRVGQKSEGDTPQ
jgi:acyl phosphate:glycerol-3-phosphate acyltransferase